MNIAVIGLGYVGLPLAVALAAHQRVVGFDIDPVRIQELSDGFDRSDEVDSEQLRRSTLTLTDQPTALAWCSVFIVAVPTPVSADRQPDLSPLVLASQVLSRLLKRGDIVVYESTVYPGCTREVCLPLLEAGSGLRCNVDFAIGYSPERINPGDKQRRLPDIVKVVSASSDAARAVLAEIYGQVVPAGIYLAPSIEVAEAAKALENTQRDVNIALMNEFAQMAQRLGIDSKEVLSAAASKWNFLPFKPGLVGGHCVGVDPYYLIFKAQQAGYFPELISASRRINEGMPGFMASMIAQTLLQKGMHPGQAQVLILGATFKPNCPDLRNTKIVELVAECRRYCMPVGVYDPWVHDQTEAQAMGLPVIAEPPVDTTVVVLAVAHRQFLALEAGGLRALVPGPVLLIDLCQVLPASEVDAHL